MATKFRSKCYGCVMAEGWLKHLSGIYRRTDTAGKCCAQLSKPGSERQTSRVFFDGWNLDLNVCVCIMCLCMSVCRSRTRKGLVRAEEEILREVGFFNLCSLVLETWVEQWENGERTDTPTEHVDRVGHAHFDRVASTTQLLRTTACLFHTAVGGVS